MEKFQDLFPSDKGCSIPPMSTKLQSLFSTVVTSVSMFIGRLFSLICIKFDRYNSIPIAFFSLTYCHLVCNLLFLHCYGFVCLCILTLFSTFSVLISSNNSLGKFSSVKFTFCVFSFGANTFFKKNLNFQTRHGIK